MHSLLIILAVFGVIVVPLLGATKDVIQGFGIFFLRVGIWLALLLTAVVILGAVL